MAKKTNNPKKEPYTTICPKCKSPDVYQDKSTLQQIGAIPTMYICNRCQHAGHIFPEAQISELENLYLFSTLRVSARAVAYPEFSVTRVYLEDYAQIF